MNEQSIVLIGGAAALAFIAASTVDESAPTFVWNASASAPIGLYAIAPETDLAIPDLVAIRPPEPLASILADGSYLPKGVLLLKRVVGLPGQRLCRVGFTVSVDDIELGVARERDSRGRALPIWQGCRGIADDEVFVMNWDNPDSYDGRYFGPLPAASIVGRASPLLTFEE
jgi:conjugative transfer signal peptidase TraF